MNQQELKKIIEEEGDYEEWIHEESGYHCSISRGDLGFWRGYVTLPDDSPDRDTPYDEVEVDVHGGFTCKCGPSFGFDCGHAGDLVPYILFQDGWLAEGDVYRDKKYAKEQTNKMALQFYRLTDNI